MPVHKVLDGRYELSGLLGVGGTGEIYDGWDTRLHRPVAVKLLRREVGGRPDVRRRFAVEARAAAALSHRCIVGVYDTGEYDGRPYIVMERLQGRTLADDIARGPLPDVRVRTVLAGILEALVAAHDAGILHRDIKPANVLIAANGDIKVADFGIAKSVGDDLTRTGELVGTVAYLSPDRIAGHLATASDDLYALGVVGYEALCGRRPFTEDNILSLARAIMHEQPRPLSEVRPDADPGLVAVIERAMAHDPSDRFGSAREMLAALGSSGESPGSATTVFPARGIVTPLTTSVTTRGRTDRPHGVLVAAGLTLVGAIAVGGLALGFGRGSDSPPATPSETHVPGTSAAVPQRIQITTDAPETAETVDVPASTAAEIPVISPTVSVPESSPVTPTVESGAGPDSRGNNGNGNPGGNNGNGSSNGNNGNGNNGNYGNNGNGNRGNGNGR